MTKHRDLAVGNVLPESFVDALAEFISTHISPNAVLSVLNANTVQLTAATDNGQVCVGINGRWRYITSSVQATDPGGAAAVHALWATASDNSFAIGPPEVDSTNYTFALAITTGAAPVGPTLSRQIGYVEWNGSAIVNARMLLDDSNTRGTLEPGDLIWSASPTRQGALLCDGASYLRTAWPALFNALGGASSPWGLPDGTHFNVPDLRGRSLIGVGSGTGLTVRTLGQTGGEERHTLSAAESGVPVHPHPSGGTITGTTGTGVTGTGTSGNDSPDHVHTESTALAIPNSGALAPGTGSFDTALPNPGGINTGGASVRHQHSVPALSVPSLSTSATDPATPNNTAAAASTSHENMHPWAAGYVFIKT